jgi:hypothetical protein
VFRLIWIVALCLPFLAADINGIWSGQITEPNRDPVDFSFRFVQSGTSLTGKMYTDNESVPLKDLKVEGSHIVFTVTTELNGQINKFHFGGEIRSNEIELERTRESSKNEDKPGPQVALRLKRLT